MSSEGAFDPTVNVGSAWAAMPPVKKATPQAAPSRVLRVHATGSEKKRVIENYFAFVW